MLVSALLGGAYLIYSIVYWVSTNTSHGSTAEGIGAGIATMIVFPHLIAACVAFVFNLLAWIMNHKWFALTGAILYTVAAVLFPMYFMFVIIQMILSYVGFAKLLKAPATQTRPSSEWGPSTQQMTGSLSLTSRDLVHADAMVQYCKHFHFDGGLSDNLSLELFRLAEGRVPPDTEVVMAFVGVKDFTSPTDHGAPCAFAFAVHKLIAAARDTVMEFQTEEISDISLTGNGSMRRLTIRCAGYTYDFGVDGAQANTILDFLSRSKDACMADIKEDSCLAENNVGSEAPPVAAELKQSRKPVYKSWWFWAIIAVIAALIVIAMVQGTSRNQPSPQPSEVVIGEETLPAETPVNDSANNADTPTLGESNALLKANSYLNSMAFSASGLAEQLEYEGYSSQEAQYAVAKCGADWNEQALKKAENYLDTSAFSYSGLFDQLSYEGFLPEEAQYGVDNCGADWNEQAAEKAQSYLDFSSFSREGLIDQLLYEGFTQEQAEYGVTSVGY